MIKCVKKEEVAIIINVVEELCLYSVSIISSGCVFVNSSLILQEQFAALPFFKAIILFIRLTL